MKHAVVLAAVVGAAAASRLRCQSCGPDCPLPYEGYHQFRTASETSGVRGKCDNAYGPQGQKCGCVKFTTEERNDD